MRSSNLSGTEDQDSRSSCTQEERSRPRRSSIVPSSRDSARRRRIARLASEWTYFGYGIHPLTRQAAGIKFRGASRITICGLNSCC